MQKVQPNLSVKDVQPKVRFQVKTKTSHLCSRQGMARFHFLPFLYYSKGWSIMLPLSWQQQGAEGSRDKEFIVD